MDQVQEMSQRTAVDLINLIDNETITGRIAKDVFEIMLNTGESPASIVDANNMKQVNDLSEIESVIDKIIEKNPDQVNALSEKLDLTIKRDGKEHAMSFTNGEPSKALKAVKDCKDETGTEITFYPSKSVFTMTAVSYTHLTLPTNREV